MQKYFVVGFNHNTIVDGPDDNANTLLKIINGATPAKIAIIAHSRGGLVSRSFVDGNSVNSRSVNKILTAGSPHQGTTIAGDAETFINFLLNFATPTGIAGEIVAFVLSNVIQTGLFEGIFDMNPGCSYLSGLNTAARANMSQPNYIFAKTAYTPDPTKVVDVLMNGLFGGNPNDLVVDTLKMTPGPVGATNVIATLIYPKANSDNNVDHFHYFDQDDLRLAITNNF